MKTLFDFQTKRKSVSEIADSDDHVLWIVVNKIDFRKRFFLKERNFKWNQKKKTWSRIYDQRVPALLKEAEEVLQYLEEQGSSWKIINLPPPVRLFANSQNIPDFGMQCTAAGTFPAAKGWWNKRGRSHG